MYIHIYNVCMYVYMYMPALISLRSRAAIISSSLSYTSAVPENVSPSLPVILATERQRFS